jgi:putative membrane protein insertion efficiency factor
MTPWPQEPGHLPGWQRLLRRAVWVGIRGYQLTLSFWLGRQCRFTPSCSCYAQEAVLRHGLRRGGWLASKRVLRCGPMGGQGYDPVPH